MRRLTAHGASRERTIITVRRARERFSQGSTGAPLECGGRALLIVAGPCAVEGGEMLLEVARAVRAAGATMLRGGAYKSRTSPYAFQGLGVDALELLSEAREATGLGIVTEVLDPRHVEIVAQHADMIQVGARNMHNHALLAELGRAGRPVLLKRGLAATLDELLLAAEHVMAHGNPDVILCERGIRTFETKTRNTLDISAIPALKSETHLPILVDPSHAGGRTDLVAPLACAAIAAGADGLLIEVHPDPARALSDGDQSLTPDAFADLMVQLTGFAVAADRGLWPPAPATPSMSDEVLRAVAGNGGAAPEPPLALTRARAEIAALDREIVALIGRRVGVAREAGQVKRAVGLPITDEVQEQEVMRRVRDLAAASGLPHAELRELQRYLIDISRRAQAQDPNSREQER